MGPVVPVQPYPQLGLKLDLDRQLQPWDASPKGLVYLVDQVETSETLEAWVEDHADVVGIRPEHVRDRRVIEVVVVAQDDRRPVTRGKMAQSLLERHVSGNAGRRIVQIGGVQPVHDIEGDHTQRPAHRRETARFTTDAKQPDACGRVAPKAIALPIRGPTNNSWTMY